MPGIRLFGNATNERNLQTFSFGASSPFRQCARKRLQRGHTLWRLQHDHGHWEEMGSDNDENWGRRTGNWNSAFLFGNFENQTRRYQNTNLGIKYSFVFLENFFSSVAHVVLVFGWSKCENVEMGKFCGLLLLPLLLAGWRVHLQMRNCHQKTLQRRGIRIEVFGKSS